MVENVSDRETSCIKKAWLIRVTPLFLPRSKKKARSYSPSDDILQQVLGVCLAIMLPPRIDGGEESTILLLWRLRVHRPVAEAA